MDEVISKINNAAVDLRTMQLDEGLISIIIRMHGLEFYETYFRQQNSSFDLPYHNGYHSYCMVANVYEASVFHGLSIHDRRALIAAALFHDFRHSGGHFPDEYNINIAVAGLFAAHGYVHGKMLTDPPTIGDRYAMLTPRELMDAVDTLRITKYPYEGQPQNLLQEIIRDADLMQVYEEDDEKLRKQFMGLKKEMELKLGSMTDEQWANGSKDFNDKVVWHTVWAQRKAIKLDHAARTNHLRNLLIGNT